MSTYRTNIPTIASTVERGKFDNNTYTIHEMSDGTYRTAVNVLDGQGYEHYQSGRYFTNVEDAKEMVRQTLATLNA